MHSSSKAFLALSGFATRASGKTTVPVAPALLRSMEDGSEQVIKEDDLFKYQRYRWLRNERQKLAARYRKFHLGALLDVAAKAKGDNGRSCVKVLKCIEGQFNKAFMLTMDNGDELVARLPNPNAGPPFYTLASEVATREFLRTVLGIPVPRIYTWSSEVSNPVGAEYIIEEKANGQPLGSLWFQWSKESHLDMVHQIVDLEARLASVSFSKHGSIYYRSDLESKGVAYEPLESVISRVDALTIDEDGSPLKDFAIGPTTDPKLWEGERAIMDVDRGPWASSAGYVNAIGMNELQWANSYARPRMNFHRSMEHRETPDDYISLLNRYLKLAPYLVTTRSEQLKTISHPDLHLDNIFVNPETRHISCLIDWQSTAISPVFLQRKFPQMLEPLAGSTQVTSSTGDEEQCTDLLGYYQLLVTARNHVRWATLNEKYHSVRTKPISLVPGCWDREDLFSLRNSLLAIAAHWKDIAPDSTPCPIEFTSEELESHQNEMELLEGLSSIMHQLQDEATIPIGGTVRPEDYQRVQELNNRFKQDFIALGEDDRQRALHANVWPY